MKCQPSAKNIFRLFLDIAAKSFEKTVFDFAETHVIIINRISTGGRR